MTSFISRFKRQTPTSLVRIVSREARRVWNRRWYFRPPSVPDSVTQTTGGNIAIGLIAEKVRLACVDDANAVLEGRRECFDAIEIHPESQRWDTDLFSGHRWAPLTFYQNYRFIQGSDGSDIKVPWELSRGYHLVTLAKAYHVTGNERYAVSVGDEILKWIADNPYAKSVNWTCAMEVAIRSVNWLWALRICSHFFHSRFDVIRSINRSLYVHGVFIRGNLEKNVRGYSSNHYYADLVGLIYLGLHFRSDAQARQWLRLALNRFYEQTLVQFYPSGPHFELAIGYHRLVTEMLLSVLCRLKRENIVPPADVMDRAKKAIDYIASYTRADGSVPLIGDADDGRLHILGTYCNWDRGSHQHLLAIGHALFGDQRWVQGNQSLYEEAAYLIDDASVFDLASSPPPTRNSQGFRDAGMYLLRHGSHMICVKLSNQGAFETAGWHTHNDVLSFDITFDGVPIVVDPGVGNYSGNMIERNLFRSTRMHNTVMVDGIEQNSFKEGVSGLWSNGGEAKPTVELWRSDSEEDMLKGSHVGYARLSSPVIHRRMFLFRKRESIFEVTDSFECEGPHSGEWNYVLHPDIVPRRMGDSTWALEGGGCVVRFECDIPLEARECWYSPGYKRKILTLRLCGSEQIQGSREFLTRFTVIK